MAVAPERVRAANRAPLRADGELVLYWMLASRRVRFNPALERAAALATELGRPLVVVEPLASDTPYACDRFHAFVLDGMAETARALAGRAAYHPYVERGKGEAEALLAALAARACAVVTDDVPTSSVARAVDRAARALTVRLEAVDGSCVVPFRLAGRDFPSAHAYRRHLQRTLPRFLDLFPVEDPLSAARPARRASLAAEIRRWPPPSPAELARPTAYLASLPIEHRISPAAKGGAAAGATRLRSFVADRLARYAEERASPDARATSGLSPWLHFGHVSSFEVVRAVLAREGWTPPPVPPRADGARSGWWGLSAGAEAFLDQVVTWRELGFVTCAHRSDHREYDSLPEWSRATLAKHARDRRPALYPREELAAAATGDPLWNAAQRQLVREGVVHNQLRMLWGKRILEWSPSPREAHATMLDLNDRYALDGSDPNSVSGIAWCLGRYDRPWGPERPVLGTVRGISSARTARKVALAEYLREFGA